MLLNLSLVHVLSKQICRIKKIKINAMGGKLTYVFVRGMPSFEIKIPGSVHLFKKAWILWRMHFKVMYSQTHNFYPYMIRLKQIMALFLEERSFSVFHYRRNEQLKKLSCFGVYRPLASFVIMKEYTSYRVHHVNVMISIYGDIDDDDDVDDGKICIVTHLSLI